MNFLKNWFIIRKEIRKNLLKWIQKQKTTILIKKSLKKNLKKLKQKPDLYKKCFTFFVSKCFKQKKLETLTKNVKHLKQKYYFCFCFKSLRQKKILFFC